MAFGDGRRGVALARQGERVLLLATDAHLLGHVLARLAHRERVMPGRQSGVDEAPTEGRVYELPRAALVRALGLEHHIGRARHRFDAAGDKDVPVADCDRMGGRIDGLESAAAQPIHSQSGDLDGQAGQQQGHASDVAVVLAGLVGAAQDDVLDQRRIDPRSVDQSPDHRGRQIVGPDGRERPAVAPERSPQRSDDPGLANGSIGRACHIGPIVRLNRFEPTLNEGRSGR